MDTLTACTSSWWKDAKDFRGSCGCVIHIEWFFIYRDSRRSWLRMVTYGGRKGKLTWLCLPICKTDPMSNSPINDRATYVSRKLKALSHNFVFVRRHYHIPLNITWDHDTSAVFHTHVNSEYILVIQVIFFFNSFSIHKYMINTYFCLWLCGCAIQDHNL